MEIHNRMNKDDGRPKAESRANKNIKFTDRKNCPKIIFIVALIVLAIIVVGGSFCFHYLSKSSPTSANNSSLVDKLIEFDDDDFLFFEKNGDIERITVQPQYFYQHSAIIELENDVTVARTAGGFIVLRTHNGELITVNATSTEITVNSPRGSPQSSVLVNVKNETVTVAFANGTSTRYSIKHYNDNEAKRMRVFLKGRIYPQYYYWGPRKIVIQTDRYESPITVFSKKLYTVVNCNGVSVLMTTMENAVNSGPFSTFVEEEGGDIIPVWTNFHDRLMKNHYRSNSGNYEIFPLLTIYRTGKDPSFFEIIIDSDSTTFERRGSSELAIRRTHLDENDRPQRRNMIIRPSELHVEERNENGKLYVDFNKHRFEIRATKGPIIRLQAKFCELWDGNDSHRLTLQNANVFEFEARNELKSLKVNAKSESISINNAGDKFLLENLEHLTIATTKTGNLTTNVQSKLFTMPNGMEQVMSAGDLRIYRGAIGNVTLTRGVISSVSTAVANLTNVGADAWRAEYPGGWVRADKLNDQMHASHGRVNVSINANYNANMSSETGANCEMKGGAEGSEKQTNLNMSVRDVGEFASAWNEVRIVGKLAIVTIKNYPFSPLP